MMRNSRYKFLLAMLAAAAVALLLLTSLQSVRRTRECREWVVKDISWAVKEYAQYIRLYIGGNMSEVAAHLGSVASNKLQENLVLISILNPAGRPTWSRMTEFSQNLHQLAVDMYIEPDHIDNESLSLLADAMETLSSSLFQIVVDRKGRSVSPLTITQHKLRTVGLGLDNATSILDKSSLRFSFR